MIKTFTYFFYKPKHLFKIAVLISCVLLLSDKANAQGATCAAATAITAGNCTNQLNISNAVADLGTVPVPCTAGSTLKAKGWFSFSPAANTNYTISATSITPNTDLVLQLLTLSSGTCNTATANFSLISCTDNAHNNPTSTIPQTEVYTYSSATPPATVYIRIISVSTALISTPAATMVTGICINPSGSCSSPTVLAATCTNSLVIGNSTYTTGSDPSCFYSASTFRREHWYQYTIPSTTPVINNQTLSVTSLTTGTNQGDVIIQIFSGTCGGPLTELTGGCANVSDLTTVGLTETATATGLTPGNTYLIRVLDYTGGSATVTLQNRICINTTCTGAVPLTSGSCLGNYTIAGLNNPAFTTVPPSTCTNGGVYAERWFSYSPATTGSYTVFANTSVLAQANLAIQVYQGTCPGALTPIAGRECVDNNYPSGTLGSQNEAISFVATNPNTYYIRLVSLGYSTLADVVSQICVNPNLATNDTCAAAISIPTPTPGATCTGVTGTLSGATSFNYAGTTCSGNNVTNEDVWYSFTTSSNAAQVYNISLSGMDNPAFEIDSSSCGGTSISCQDASSGSTAEFVTLSTSTLPPISPNRTYWIRVYDGGYGIPATPTFSLCLSSPPINDECAHAVSLSPANTCVATTGTVNLATLSPYSVTCSGTVSDDDVWYYFKANNTAQRVSVTGTGIAPVFEVYNAAAPVTSPTCLGSSIVCNASATVGATISSTVTTIANNYYFVRVYNYGGAATAGTGAFTICILNKPPVNDECTGAISLTPSTTCSPTTGNVAAATQSLPANLTCNSSTLATNDDVWYSFVAAQTDQTVTVKGNATFDPVFEVYSIACGTNSLGCTNATTGGGTESNVLTGLTPGATYWVQVYDAGTTAPVDTTFTICITSPPANDNCVGATTLVSQPVAPASATYLKDTVSGATSSGIATLCGTADDDVWFSFTAASTTETVNVIESGTYSAVIELFSGNCTAPTSLGCYNPSVVAGIVSQSYSGLTLGATYLVRVYDYGAGTPGSSSFFIAITHTLNDICSQAIPVTCGNSYSGTTASATSTGDPNLICGANAAGTHVGVWYSFTGIGGSVSLNTTTSAAGTKVNVYSVTSACGTLTCVSAGQSTSGSGQSLTFSSTSGTTYYIYVYNSTGTSGTFTLAITSCGAGIANDLCTGAISVDCGNNGGAGYNGTTILATTAGDPTARCGTTITAPGVWYVFIGTGSTVTADLCTNLTYDTKLNIFSSPTACGALTCVNGNDNARGNPPCGLGSRVTFTTVSGTYYYLFVSGRGTATGTFTLNISCVLPPANDACANAIAVSCGGTYTGSTTLATNTGDYTGTIGTSTYSGACGFNSSSFYYYDYENNTAPGVWYVYHSTTSTSITASLCGSSYDTQISVFTGACGGLTCVGGNDDFCGLQSSITFSVVPCTDYYIFVNGYFGSKGAFTLSVTGSGCTSAPTNDLCTNATVIPSCGTTGLTGTTVGATTTGDPTATCGTAITGPGVWYIYNASDSLYLQASLCNTTASACYPLYNNVVNVYSGSCASLNCIGGNSGFCASSSQVNFLTNSGSNNYYIFVQGSASTEGPFTLDLNGIAVTTGQVIGSTTSTGNFGACVPLPIELLSFTGQSQGSRNILNWETASETNNDYFTIEKSQDAISFSPLDRVNGAGNSSHAIKYSMYDNKPFKDLTYYRLKQTDYNGVYTYSTIIAVANSLNETSVSNIRPNPTSDNINFDLFMTIKGKITVQIIDFSGQVVHEETQDVTDGSSVMTVNMNDLSPGVYSLKVTSDHSGFVTVTKVVKN